MVSIPFFLRLVPLLLFHGLRTISPSTWTSPGPAVTGESRRLFFSSGLRSPSECDYEPSRGRGVVSMFPGFDILLPRYLGIDSSFSANPRHARAKAPFSFPLSLHSFFSGFFRPNRSHNGFSSCFAPPNRRDSSNEDLGLICSTFRSGTS